MRQLTTAFRINLEADIKWFKQLTKNLSKSIHSVIYCV